jgi:hypothetical protein
MPLSSTFEGEAERLGAGWQACRPEVIRIKTGDAQLEMISQASAMSLDMRPPSGDTQRASLPGT